MRFKLIPKSLLMAGLCVCMTSGELWLRHGFAAQKSRIVFATLRFDNLEISVMDADGGNQENLTNHPVDDMDPAWSPDGTKIAFVSNRNDGVYQVYVMDADGTNQIQLTDGPREKRFPDWSPDGGKIAFTVRDAEPHIAVMDADGNNRERFEDHATEPSWSPDGKKIAFLSWRDKNHGIYAIGTDGQGLEKVTHGHSPSYSPDGRRIAYYEGHKGFRHVYVIDTDGKNRQRLTHNQGHHSHPTWSPDGEAIAYMVYKDVFFLGAKIHLMTTDGNHLKQLSDVHDGLDFHPDFSTVGPAMSVSPTSNTATTWGRLKKISSRFR